MSLAAQAVLCFVSSIRDGSLKEKLFKISSLFKRIINTYPQALIMRYPVCSAGVAIMSHSSVHCLCLHNKHTVCIRYLRFHLGMIMLVCYTCACIAVYVNVCTPRRAGGSPVHASWEPSCNLQYNAIGQITLVGAVCLQEDSCQIVSRLPGKHSLPSSTPTHHPTELSHSLSLSLIQSKRQ